MKQKILLSFLCAAECRSNSDCPRNKACDLRKEECVDPCLTTICGTRAVCKVESHNPICQCERGLQGNPRVSCTEVGCRSNSDCSDREACKYVPGSRQQRECQPLCLQRPCAFGASCMAKDHREVCTCNPPLRGDGYLSCIERE